MATKKFKNNSIILEGIHETMSGFYAAGVIDDERMNEFNKLCLWNTVDHLKTDEDRAAYLEACLEEAGDDPVFIAKALDNIAKAKGMTELVSRETNPSLGATLKVIKALGIRLHAEAVTL